MKAINYVFIVIIVAVLVSEANSAALTPGNLLVVRGPFATTWQRIYIDEITTSGTVVQTIDPNCLIYNAYLATGLVFNQDYTAAAFTCHENEATPSLLTTKKLAVAIRPDGTIDKTTVTQGLEALDLYTALIDGRNVWVGADGPSLSYSNRNGNVYLHSMISTPQYLICDLQMVGNEFYVGGQAEDIYQIAKVVGGPPKSLTVLANVEELYPSMSLSPYPFGNRFFMYSATEIYYAGTDGHVYKILKDSNGWRSYDGVLSSDANGVSAADVASKRMVYLAQKDRKIVSIEDTGSTFGVPTLIKDYGATIGVWDVAYIKAPLATCSDNIKNQDEGDKDCGGYYCPLCANAKTCIVSEDCQSSYCNPNSVCSTPSCTDTFKNQDETDVDCGGVRCSAYKCADGKTCATNSDCSSNYCNPNKVCSVPSCSDGFLNQDEMSVDCGGATCPKCADGASCNNAGFCQSGYCNPSSKCATPSCSDGFLNQDEIDIDCGGNICNKCADGKDCVDPVGCLSGYCYQKKCLTPSCNDQIKNGDETDVDCGAACALGCATGQSCFNATDCVDNYCKDSVCTLPTCSDAVLNGLETDVDCGGTSCSGCEVGKSCGDKDINCASNLKCVAGVCTATCSDNLKNQNETAVDCGGVCGATCADGDACNVNGDCMNSNCANGFCGGVSNSPMDSPSSSTSPSASNSPSSGSNTPSQSNNPIAKPVSSGVQLTGYTMLAMFALACLFNFLV